MEYNLDKFTTDLLVDWGVENDHKLCEKLSRNIEKLLNSTDSNTQLCSIIKFLLKNFQYYTKETVNLYLSDLHRIFLSQVDPDHDALHTYIKKKDGRINSSFDYFHDYKYLNSINKDLCLDDLTKIKQQHWNAIKQIVILDDCCGSGNTIKEYIEATKLNFNDKTLYYIVVHLMVEAKDTLKHIERQFENFKIITISITEKNKIFTDINISKKKNIFLKYSERMGINKKYILGYKDTEALFAFYNNCPNNTLGLFWADGNLEEPLFPRNKRYAPSWTRPSFKEMKEDKVKRNAQNYNRKA